MPFLGTTPTQGFVGANPKQSFTANGSTTVFTLTNPVASANDLEVFVGNVRQEPTAAYTAAGTTLTMSEAPDTGLNFYVINKSQAQVTTTPPINSITTDKILNDAVTQAKIASGAIDATELASTLNLASKTLTIPTTTVKPMFVNFYTNSVLTLTNDTMVKLPLEAQGLNNGVTWDGTNYRVTFDATTAGKYLIIMSMSYYNNNNNMSEALLQIRRDNSQINHPLFDASGTGGGVRMDEMRHITRTAITVEGFTSGQYLDFWGQLQVGAGSAQLQPRLYGTQGFIMRIND